MKKDCIWIPTVKVGTEEVASTLFKDLKKNLNNDTKRAIYAYEAYLATNLADKLDQQGYTRDILGQHNYKDVLRELEIEKIFAKTSTEEESVARYAGIIDASKRSISFTGLEALQKAMLINENPAFVARIVKVGDQYQVKVSKKDSKTHTNVSTIEDAYNSWNMIIDSLKTLYENPNTFDLSELEKISSSILDITNPMGFTSYLRSIPSTRSSYYSIPAIHMLLTMAQHFPEIPFRGQSYNFAQNIQSIITNRIQRQNPGVTMTQQEALYKASEDIYNNLHATSAPNNTLINWYSNLLDQIKQYINNTIDLDALHIDVTAANGINRSSISSREQDIKQQLDDIRRLHDIDTEIIEVKDKIESLSDIITEEIFQIERQIRSIESKSGVTQQTQKLSQLKDNLFKELEVKSFKDGSLQFIKTGIDYLNTFTNTIIPDMINRQVDGEYVTFEDLQFACSSLAQLKNFSKTYERITNALEYLDSKDFDIDISQQEYNDIKQAAADFNKLLRDILQKDEFLRNYEKLAMRSLYRQTFGENSPLAAISFGDITSADGTILDYLYSVGRQSNKFISVWGAALKNAQDSHTTRLLETARKIRIIRNKYVKSSNGDDSFMVDSKYNILSDINWDEWYRARGAYRHSQKQNGLSGVALKLALQAWEDSNSEDRVVYIDASGNKLIERVPNGRFRLNNGLHWDSTNNRMVFDKSRYTDAQEEYYNEMMALKGELQSYSPNYAQHIYKYPYIRKSWLDVISDKAKKKYSWGQTIRTLLDRMKFWKIREDDTDISQNGLIDDEEDINITQSTWDDTILRRIPIFYRRKIETLTDKNGNIIGQDEILTDFATALQHYAATIIGYDEMNKMKDILETTADYIKYRKTDIRRNGDLLVDVIENPGTVLVKRLAKTGTTRSGDLVSQFVARDIYGIKRLPINDNDLLDNILRSIVSYTGLKMLATNVKGATANLLMGKVQLLIEAAANQRFNFKEWALGTTDMISVIFTPEYYNGDFFSHNRNSYHNLLMELFDPMMEIKSETWHHRYHTSKMRTVLSNFNAYFLYSTGEQSIHIPTMYAVIRHQKVNYNGKKVSLKSVIEKKEILDANNKGTGVYHLVIKDGVEDPLKPGQQLTIDSEYIHKVKKIIRETNQNMHGSMNEEDKGLIHRYTFGKAFMALRQWMIEHYSRRYRGRHISSDLEEEVEGYNVTTYKFLKDLSKRSAIKLRRMLGAIAGIKKLKRATDAVMLEQLMVWNSKNIHQKTLDPEQRANIRRAIAEATIYAALLSAGNFLGEPEDHKREFWRRFWIYQQRRLLSELSASYPTGVLSEGMRNLTSYSAAIPILNSTFYLVLGLKDLGTPLGPSSVYAGKDKYLINVYKHFIPFAYQIEQMFRFDEDDAQFNIFNTDVRFNR